MKRRRQKSRQKQAAGRLKSDLEVRGGSKARRMKPSGWAGRYNALLVLTLAAIAVGIFAEFIFSDDMLYGTDMIPMGYMMRKVVAEYWKSHGSLPLWDRYILGGIPVVDAMHGDLFYPTTVFYFLMPLHKALGYKIVLHVWLAGLTMYFLARTLGLRRQSALLAGVSYMAAPYIVSLTYAGHDAKIFVTALFPLSVALLERFLWRTQFRYAVLFGGSVGLLFLTSHPQMAYFASWGLLVYFVFNIPRLARAGKLPRAIALLAMSVVLALCLASIQFLPTYFYTTNFSPRTGGVTFEYAASWSLHPEEIVSLMYPHFVGYSTRDGDTYWGRNLFKLNSESPGPLVLLLAIGGILIFRGKRGTAPWLFLFFFCPIYALGAHTPIFNLIFRLVPGAKFLRAVSVIMFMFSCSVCVLAAHFVDDFLGGALDKVKRNIATALFVVALSGGLLMTIFRESLFGFWAKNFCGELADEKLIIFKNSARTWDWGALVLVAMAGIGLYLLAGAYREKRNGWPITALLAAGVLVTSLMYSTAFVGAIGLEEWVRPDPMVERMAADGSRFRVFPNVGSNFYDRNYLPIFGLETVNGFYDNRIARYEFLAGRGSVNLQYPNIMNMLNVKYLILRGRYEIPSLVLERDLGEVALYRNERALPRAYLVHEAVVATSDTLALEILKDPEFDPSRAIILHEGQELAAERPGEAEEVQIAAYEPNKVVVRVKAAAPGYLFFGENYLPYWKASIRGNEVPLLRCNISMRAVYVEPGDHMIEMKYCSPWYRIGRVLFFGACVFMAAGLYIGYRLAPKRTEDAKDTGRGTHLQ
jgi:hypothetical protein